MYKETDHTQSSFLNFNQPIGLHMNSENRWIQMADAIPWKGFKKRYSRLFKGKNGRVAKPLRLALGALIIQIHQQMEEKVISRKVSLKMKENLCWMQPAPHRISATCKTALC